MAGDMFDDDENEFKLPNPGLFIQNAEPLKIYLDGFSMKELVVLIKRVTDYGGEISHRVGNGIIILSHPESSLKTGFPRFRIKWLHDCIKFNEIVTPFGYLFQIPSTNTENQVEQKELNLSIVPMNKISKQKNNAVDCSSTKDSKRKKSEVSSSSRTQAPTNTGRNTVTENAKCRKKLNYTEEEDQAMIDYLIKNDAIGVAGGLKIWERMHKDGMLRNHSVRSLFDHFRRYLNGRAREFTSDKEALEKFESENLKCTKPRRKYCYYTEEENQAMIDYLIENDAFGVAGGLGIWKRMHKDGMLLNHPVKSMANHACTTLNRRAREYTSDREALKEFELRDKIRRCESRRNNRRLSSSDSEA